MAYHRAPLGENPRRCHYAGSYQQKPKFNEEWLGYRDTQTSSSTFSESFSNMGKKRKRNDSKASSSMSLDESTNNIVEDQSDVTVEREAASGPPSPRSHMTLTPHPLKDELILFGGEFQHGSKVTMYNDLYIYKIHEKQWTRIVTNHSPCPRSSHQASGVDTCIGQLWVFGGETTLKSQVQHHKDLWVLHLRENKWEQVKCTGGPTARSGHRMVEYMRHLIVFGGFIDNNKSYTYFNDVYAFSLDDYTWTQLHPTGTGPSPRSACQLGVVSDKGVVLYGGYSRSSIGRGSDKGTVHSDMFLLAPEDSPATDVSGDGPRLAHRWCWHRIPQSGELPSPRVGMTWIQTPEHRAVSFGGVYDEVQSEDSLKGRFFNDLYMVNLKTGFWYSDIISSKKLTRKRRRDKGDDRVMECDSVVTASDSTQSLCKRLRLSTVAQSQSHAGHQSLAQPVILTEPSPADMDVDMFAPPPRMNPSLAVKAGVLYVYGGFIEKRDRQVTLADFYSLDLHKLTAWDVLIPYQTSSQAANQSESSSESDDSDSQSDVLSSDSQSETAVTFDDAPKPMIDEALKPYTKRTRTYWLEKAHRCSTVDGLRMSARNLQKLANDLTSQFYNR